MNRYMMAMVAGCLLGSSPTLRADTFDRYVNPILMKAPGAKGVQQVKELTRRMITDNSGVLPEMAGALVIVQTNEGRFSKLSVEAAFQKIKTGAKVPILLIERYVTYSLGQERAVEAKGQNVKLFSGFRLSLDIGQVVPPELTADLRFVAEGSKNYVVPVGRAKLYLVTQPLPGTEPKKSSRLAPGATFEPCFFNGTYQLFDDGRRSGKLILKLGDKDRVTGYYYSDKDGRKYEVMGKIGNPKHAIEFTIKFPRTQEQFQGWLFTGNGKALAGTSRLLERQAGFYAVRVED